MDRAVKQSVVPYQSIVPGTHLPAAPALTRPSRSVRMARTARHDRCAPRAGPRQLGREDAIGPCYTRVDSRLKRSTRPGVAPVATPSRTIACPLTMVLW